MSEVTFAKAFLVSLDKKSIKLPADHVSDPRKYPNQSPYILPKQTHAFPKKDPAQLANETISVTIKSMKGGNAVTLSDVSLQDIIHDIKSRYALQVGLTIDKIKLLFNKRPAADLKTLQELGIDKDVDFAAMLMGNAIAETPIASPALSTPAVDKMDIDSQPASAKARAEQKPTSPDALMTDEFWSDLEGFLSQRLKDQDQATKLAKLFKGAWSAS